MLDHISLSVNDYKKSVEFYDSTLSILGIDKVMVFEIESVSTAGYGKNGKPYFWIGAETKPNLQEYVGKSRGFHVAFLAPSIQAIHAWHQKCLELGAKDNGTPGPRVEYHPGYYAAFVIDPNGYRLEAVLHTYKKEEH